MTGSMNKIAKYNFPHATLGTDSFHVQILATEADQEKRTKQR